MSTNLRYPYTYEWYIEIVHSMGLAQGHQLTTTRHHHTDVAYSVYTTVKRFVMDL